MEKRYGLAIHGGAGTILKKHLTDQQEKEFQDALRLALKGGHMILKQGGSSTDAVTEAVRLMEDCPLFNAGRGAVFGNDGTQEMEAAIMEGSQLQAGAVAGVSKVRNPVVLSQKILTDSEFVYMHGKGALEFAREKGLPLEADSFFYTQHRYDQLIAAREEGKHVLDHDGDRKFGTVGAVALDVHGNLASATSTGGLTNKKYGRVGDSSVIGSGTYANNKTCAVSCTGYGEYFLRAVVAYDISCLIEYKQLSLAEACKEVVQKKLVAMQGEGGVIAINAKGDIVLSFNSEGMYRGQVSSEDETYRVAIFDA